jgi:stage V sporulation protein AB
MRHIFLAFLGLASGTVIAGAVFAFIAAIGVVTRMAQRSNTGEYIIVYEEAIIWGGIFGAVTMAFNVSFNISLPAFPVFIAFLSLFIGIFFGVLAMCLAETLDVLPILGKRLSIQKGMQYLILAIALGKMSGSLLYFMVSGFYKPGG